jgi:chromosome partitioning protein
VVYEGRLTLFNMTRRIAFINYKGGVGKTSLIVNVGACLAQMGRRVLLCDLDTQSNSSIWLLRLERWNSLVERRDAALPALFRANPPKLSDIIVRHSDAAGSRSAADDIQFG